jgi:hypothetical protein
MSVDDDRLRHLNEIKLRALVRGVLAASAQSDSPEPDLVSVPAGNSAALRVGDDLWVYPAGEAERALGRALVLLVRQAPAVLHLVLDVDSPLDARRAAIFNRPVRVWRVDGTELVPVVAVPLASPADPPAGSSVGALVGMLEEAGVDVVVEHGVIIGEVRGLEVARVRVDDEGQCNLDIGVGRFDQEAAALIHGDKPTAVALADAASLVRGLRVREGAPHPVNRLARERWLRAQLLVDPGLIGLDELAPISPPMARRNVKDPAPAAAIGVAGNGEIVLVVCTVGVDLDWVPIAADLVSRERPDRIIAVLPQRDLLPVQRELAALLPVPVNLVALEGDWPV